MLDLSNIGVTDIMLGFTGYVTIWIFCLFFTLPFFYESQDISKRTVEDPGAPKHAHIKKKLVITSILAFVIWAGFHYWLLREGFSFWQWIAN